MLCEIPDSFPYYRLNRPHKQKDPAKTKACGIPVSWALEPRCRIMVFLWSFGVPTYIHAACPAFVFRSVEDGAIHTFAQAASPNFSLERASLSLRTSSDVSDSNQYSTPQGLRGLIDERSVLRSGAYCSAAARFDSSITELRPLEARSPRKFRSPTKGEGVRAEC